METNAFLLKQNILIQTLKKEKFELLSELTECYVAISELRNENSSLKRKNECLQLVLDDIKRLTEI